MRLAGAGGDRQRRSGSASTSPGCIWPMPRREIRPPIASGSSTRWAAGSAPTCTGSCATSCCRPPSVEIQVDHDDRPDQRERNQRPDRHRSLAPPGGANFCLVLRAPAAGLAGRGLSFLARSAAPGHTRTLILPTLSVFSPVLSAPRISLTYAASVIAHSREP